MLRGIGGMMGFGKGGKGAKGVKGGKSSGFDVSKMGQSKQTKQPIKPGMIDRMGGVKNIARTGARSDGPTIRHGLRSPRGPAAPGLPH